MKKLLYAVVGVFLLLFMVLPITSLLLAGFTGIPIPIVGFLADGDPGGLISAITDSGSLQFYREFWQTPRYRQGLFNSVGLVPMVAVAAFLFGLGVRKALGAHHPVARLAGLPLTATLSLLTIAWAIGWPSLFPNSSLGPILAGAPEWKLRLLQSLGYCPMVTLCSTAIGVAVAFALRRTNMPGREFFRMLAILPLSMPPFLGALAFRNLMGNTGLLTNLLHSVGLSHPFSAQSPVSAGIVQSFLFFPFVVLTTVAALDRSDPTLGEAAEVMGARKGFAFWTVHLPVLMPGISAGAFLIFIRSFGDFATLKLLLPIQYSMIVVEAYRDLSGNTYWGGASMLSSIMIAVILTILALQKYFVERGTYETVTGKAGGSSQIKARPLVDGLALGFCLAVFAVPILFLFSTALSSVAQNWGTELLPPSYTFNRYGRIFGELFGDDSSPLLNSFLLTLPALLGTVVMAFIVAYLISRTKHWTGQALDFATMLPFVVPGVAFAVALIGAFNAPPMELHFTATLVVLAYVVTRVPYGVRSTLASFQQIGTSMEESSKTMGGTDILTLFKVTVPLVLPGVLAGAIMVFISCMQDVAITLMISPPDWYPASVFVFHEIEAGRMFDASAYGIVLLFLIMIPYAIAFKLGGVRSEL